MISESFSLSLEAAEQEKNDPVGFPQD